MIKYIGYFDVNGNNSPRRSNFLSASNKMFYIAKSISLFDKVKIISPSGVVEQNTAFGEYVEIRKNIYLKTFFSFGKKNKIIGKISTFVTKLLFYFYLLIDIKKNDKVIVYHSLYLDHFISFLKKLKKFFLIYEIEEIYSDVLKDNHKKEIEIKNISIADAYLFSTELLSQLINKNNKPEIIIYGSYDMGDISFKKEKKLSTDDSRIIHCVYAGTFDERKGGCIAAIKAAEYLPSNYIMHILGFGSESEILKVKELVRDVSKKSKSTIKYEGLLSGSKYTDFIQNCDIGLSTQNPEDDFNNSSFPSKILSYISNGLFVVSYRIPVVENSKIGNLITYYDEQTAESISKAILSIHINDSYKGKECIKLLDKYFIRNIKSIIQ